MKRCKNPSKSYVALRLQRLFMKSDGLSWGMAFALAYYHVLWDYDNWTKDDHAWLWKNLREDEKEIGIKYYSPRFWVRIREWRKNLIRELK